MKRFEEATGVNVLYADPRQMAEIRAAQKFLYLTGGWGVAERLTSAATDAERSIAQLREIAATVREAATVPSSGSAPFGAASPPEEGGP